MHLPTDRLLFHRAVDLILTVFVNKQPDSFSETTVSLVECSTNNNFAS